MKMRPLGDRILLKRVEGEEKSRGGIVIPDTAKEKPLEGTVVAVGKGRLLENGNLVPLEVEEGDRVLFGKYAGTDVRVEEEEHLLVKSDDILCVIESGSEKGC